MLPILTINVLLALNVAMYSLTVKVIVVHPNIAKNKLKVHSLFLGSSSVFFAYPYVVVVVLRHLN
jgi:hypothetical protein